MLCNKSCSSLLIYCSYAFDRKEGSSFFSVIWLLSDWATTSLFLENIGFHYLQTVNFRLFSSSSSLMSRKAWSWWCIIRIGQNQILYYKLVVYNFLSNSYMYLLQIIDLIYFPFRFVFCSRFSNTLVKKLMGLGTKYFHTRPSLIDRYLSKQWINRDNSIIISQSKSCYMSTYLLSFTYLNLSISGIFSFHLWITFQIKSAFYSPRVDWIHA